MNNTRLRDLLQQRQAIRNEIDRSRESIGLAPIVKRSGSDGSVKLRGDGSIALLPPAGRRASPAEINDAIAYGRALRERGFRYELNIIHVRGGRSDLVRFPSIASISGKGGKLYDQTRRDVIVENIDRFPLLPDDQIHARTMGRLLDMQGGGAPQRLSPTRPKSHAIRLTQVKFLGNGRRIQGFASTGDVDRVGDILEPSGMVTKLPIPLLFGHDHSKIVGTVTSAQVRPEGIFIDAEFVSGIALADEAFKLIEARAIDAFSVGFRGLKAEPLATGGLRYTKWEMYEVSVVPVPANPHARIARSTKSSSSDGSIRLAK